MNRSRPLHLILLWLVLVLMGCVPAGVRTTVAVPGSGKQAVHEAVQGPVAIEPRPNIVLITTDDQNADDLRFMPRTLRLLGDRGTTFTRAISPHPLCCPARAEILTGQYAQNNGVQHNGGVYGGFAQLHVHRTIGTWLQHEGYRTAFVGKFLNGYGAQAHPPRLPGWNIWDPFVSHWYDYYGTTFFRPRPADRQSYSVDATAAHTDAYLRRLAAQKAPFFLWVSHVAPHSTAVAPNVWGPPLAPPRDAHAFRHVVAPSLRARSFDAPGAAAAGLVGQAGSFSRSYVQHYYAQRLRSLRSVDRAVAGAIRVLRRTGELDHTYVFFTSDNGYLLAQHGLIGKNVLYAEDLGIPLVVRGPTVRTQTIPLPVSLVDLVPTFLDIASAGHPRPVDGVSFLRSLRGHRVRWRDTQLVQTGHMSAVRDASHGWTYRGVRTARYTFGLDALTGQRLLFDRRHDPAELRNLAAEPAYHAVVRELARRTRLLTDCAGSDCNRRFGPVPKPASAGPH